jgi:hypothetical protein
MAKSLSDAFTQVESNPGNVPNPLSPLDAHEVLEKNEWDEMKACESHLIDDQKEGVNDLMEQGHLDRQAALKLAMKHRFDFQVAMQELFP